MQKETVPIVLVIVLVLASSACGGATPEPTATPKPTIASEPTDTPAPTATPKPTNTLKPTDTPLPTDTPEPTDTRTPQPTNTPLPAATMAAQPTQQLSEIEEPEEKISKADIERCLPPGYAIVKLREGSADLDGDDKKEVISRVKKEAVFESLVILSWDGFRCEVKKQFEVQGIYFEEVLIRDLNQNRVPELIFVSTTFAGETGPRRLSVLEWNRNDYKLLLRKEITLFYYNRSKLFPWSKNHLRDLNNDGKIEIIVPTTGYYQAACCYPSPGECISLLHYEVYRWDGGKYIETTSEFLEVYDEDVRLAKELLKCYFDYYHNKEQRERASQAISSYLEEVNSLKETAN